MHSERSYSRRQALREGFAAPWFPPERECYSSTGQLCEGVTLQVSDSDGSVERGKMPGVVPGGGHGEPLVELSSAAAGQGDMGWINLCDSLCSSGP